MVTAMDKCVKSKLVHLSNRTTPECNGEGWVVVKMAKIGTVYILPLIIGVLMCEVGEFSFLVEEGCEKLKLRNQF